MTAPVIDPRHGAPVDLLAGPERAAELMGLSVRWASWTMTPRQLCDLELLADGGFSPLRGFLGEADHDGVCASMRLADGTLWPVPVMLDLPEELARTLRPGGMLALRDPEGVLLAALEVEEVWRPDLEAEAAAVLGTTDPAHPGARTLLHATHPYYVSGRLEVLRAPVHHDFADLRATPAQVRAAVASRGWERVVAFQTRNPMHRAHLELTLRAAAEVDANVLVHPVVGLTKPGDIDPWTRVRCYRAVMPSYPPGQAMLALLPLAMRMAGPREALWHALVRRNYGATHLIVGRDHAGPGADSAGRPFYGPYDAQELVRAHEAEVGVEMVAFPELSYLPARDAYVPAARVPLGADVASISGTEQRRRLARGEELPAWFTPPAVAAELRRSCPPRSERGFTVFFTGLSGAGKSTVAGVLDARLRERGGRSVTLLDGDLVRRHLSSELGFSRTDRDLNVGRIGFVAAEVTRAGGIAVCAPIAPYDATRRQVRRMVEEAGAFVLVHVATSLAVCEARDRKQLYAKARAGLIPSFTGVSDPYEEPTDAELVVDTAGESAEDAVDRILGWLAGEGYLPA